MSVLLDMLADEPLLCIGAFLISPLAIMFIGSNFARTNAYYRQMRERREIEAWLKREREKDRI